MAYKLGESSAEGRPPVRSLVHRRHSLREPGEVHLNDAGLELARRVGRVAGRFDRVVTSPRERAVETGVAMGFIVDARLPELAPLPDSVGGLTDRHRPATFGDYVRLVAESQECGEWARALADLWAQELDRIREGGRLLMVSHAGVLELGTVGAVGDRVARWGRALAPMEGVQLDRQSGRWVGAEVLRDAA